MKAKKKAVKQVKVTARTPRPAIVFDAKEAGDGTFYWIATAANGRCVAQATGYNSEHLARRAASTFVQKVQMGGVAFSWGGA